MPSENQHGPRPGQQSQFPPPGPGEQRSGYPAGPPEPGQPGYRPPSEPRAAPRDAKAEAELKENQAVSSIGAQIILDYNSEAGLGARGGAGGTIEENQMVRDTALVAVGLDPQSPSGPPSMAPLEPPPEVVRSTPPVSSKATRMTSLAAGILTGNEATPPPPEGGGGGATAPANTTVPAVTQTGTTLTCTQGEWSGEPTSYAYAWQIDGTAAGSDAATYEVQAGDVGKSATCTVTATNAAGSAAAPPSVGVVVA
jgi:hypothetical protein